jgi:hypothetical protein
VKDLSGRVVYLLRKVWKFRFPARVGDNKSINVTRTGLSMILEGIDLEKLPKQKRFCRYDRRREGATAPLQ